MEKHNITIYSTPVCPNCKMTRAYLNEKKIPFRDVDVSNNPDAVKEMIEKSGQMGVPVIDIDGKIVVGFQPAILNNLLGFSSDTIIVDVRTTDEYKEGHIKDSINIPLHILQAQLSKLDKNKTIITCCASGMRSAQAKKILEENGFKEVYNGGSWNNLKQTEGGGVCSIK